MKIVALAPILLLGGCVAWQAEEPTPTFDAVRAIRSGAFPAVGVGSAVVAPTLGAEGRRVVIRGSSVAAPKPGNFADFLAETLRTELRGAARFDPNAATIISVELTECHSGENMKRGEAAVGAIFTVERGGRKLFSRPYRVTQQWSSNFLGMMAIPQAFNGFTTLFPKLVEQALSDPEMVSALRG